MDSTRTRIREHRHCPEYVDIFSTDQVNETDKIGNRTQKGTFRSDGLDRIYPEHQTRVDSNFPRASFAPGEICAERQDYIRRASLTGSPVCTQTVTGSLLFGSPHRLVRGSSCLTLFLPRWTDRRTSQFADDGPVSVDRTCMPIFL